MATSRIDCGVCNLRSIAKPSVLWCHDCDEGLCTDCTEHHGLSKGTRDHTTVSIAEYKKLPANILSVAQFCNVHNEKYQIFCKKHDCPCCRRCVIENHNKCEHLSAIDDVIQNVKTSNAFSELEQKLTEITENVRKIRKDRQKNLTSLNGQRRDIETEILNLRTKINQHLDKIQAELIRELDYLEENESKKIHMLLETLEQKESEIEKYRITLANIKQHASDLQTFLSIKQLESDMTKNEEFVQSFEKSGSLAQSLLSCKMDVAVQDIINIKKFGAITNDHEPVKVVLARKKDRQAQIQVTNALSRPIQNITLTLKTKIKTMKSNAGCILIKNGNMFFSGHTYTDDCVLRCMTNDGKDYFDFKNLYPSIDITYIEETDTVALTYVTFWIYSIQLVDVNAKKVYKVGQCGGIASRNGKLYYCTDKGIHMLDPITETTKNVIVTKLDPCSYLTTFRDNIYYTNPQENTVTCSDLAGKKVHWEFKNESVLRSPRGVTVDNLGNVYIVGGSTNNVVAISSDGKQYKELLSEKDGIEVPWSLCYQRDRNELLVANYRDTAFLYTVT